MRTRTTLTLDPDVAVELRRLQQIRGQSYAGLVNEALRAGLQQLETPMIKAEPYETPSVSAGECLVGNLDDISSLLAIAEGEAYR